MAGRDFVAGFLKRHPILSLRKPEVVSLNRVFGLNKTSVEQYFSNLEILLNEFQFPPHRIYNVDESGLTCVTNKGIGTKGKTSGCISNKR